MRFVIKPAGQILETNLFKTINQKYRSATIYRFYSSTHHRYISNLTISLGNSDYAYNPQTSYLLSSIYYQKDGREIDFFTLEANEITDYNTNKKERVDLLKQFLERFFGNFQKVSKNDHWDLYIFSKNRTLTNLDSAKISQALFQEFTNQASENETLQNYFYSPNELGLKDLLTDSQSFEEEYYYKNLKLIFSDNLEERRNRFDYLVENLEKIQDNFLRKYYFLKILNISINFDFYIESRTLSDLYYSIEALDPQQDLDYLLACTLLVKLGSQFKSRNFELSQTLENLMNTSRSKKPYEYYNLASTYHSFLDEYDKSSDLALEQFRRFKHEETRNYLRYLSPTFSWQKKLKYWQYNLDLVYQIYSLIQILLWPGLFILSILGLNFLWLTVITLPTFLGDKPLTYSYNPDTLVVATIIPSMIALFFGIIFGAYFIHRRYPLADRNIKNYGKIILFLHIALLLLLNPFYYLSSKYSLSYFSPQQVTLSGDTLRYDDIAAINFDLINQSQECEQNSNTCRSKCLYKYKITIKPKVGENKPFLEQRICKEYENEFLFRDKEANEKFFELIESKQITLETNYTKASLNNLPISQNIKNGLNVFLINQTGDQNTSNEKSESTIN
jgi:hypothetical protein